MRALLLAVLLAAPAGSAVRPAGLLSAQGAAVLDSTNQPRQTFSNNEKIGFSVTVYNGAMSPNRIAFSFQVFAPNGNKVFTQSGNAVPGSVGNAAAAISGMAISSFYQGPGTYTLKTFANLDGVTLEQDQSFTVSSPNLLLIYPPNGANGLTDNPLTFQWFSSGATSYRVTVADNIAMYNPVYQATTANGANSLTYPNSPNPPDPRQRLAAGQLYYWKVEGLDLNGNVVASSPVPFSFTVASVALTRDVAVTDLAASGAPDAGGNIPFRIAVKNQGSTTEANLPLKLTVGGLPAPSSPVTIAILMPGDAKTFDLSATIPTDQNSSLAIACVTIFDDNANNNCKTLNVSRPTALSTGTAFAAPGAGLQSADQVWQAIQNLLLSQGLDLSSYQLTGMEGSLTRDELMALLDQLRQGVAQASVSGPPLPAVPAPAPSGDSGSVPAAPAAPAAPAGPPAEAVGAAETPDEVWTSLELQLRNLGVDLTGYRMTGMEGSLTRDELMDLLDQLRRGQATAVLSGPPLGAAAGAPLLPAAPPVAEEERPVAPPPAAPGEEVLEWSGYTRPTQARTATLAVRDAAHWKRLWRNLSDAPVPEIDFARWQVVAIIGGRGLKADRVEIADLRSDGSELRVRYRAVTLARMGRPDAPALGELGKTFVPYLLKAVRNDVSKVRFEAVQEKNDE